MKCKDMKFIFQTNFLSGNKFVTTHNTPRLRLPNCKFGRTDELEFAGQKKMIIKFVLYNTLLYICALKI